MKRLLLVLIVLLILTMVSFIARAQNPMELHYNSFLKVTALAEINNFYKFGLYSSRIIAVKNPEIYLQGDMYFAKLITTNPGYEQWYKIGTASRFTNFKWGPSFSFDQVKLENYRDIQSLSSI